RMSGVVIRAAINCLRLMAGVVGVGRGHKMPPRLTFWVHLLDHH
ncbi:unnamed protein product, partial [Oikopleura dioica]